MDLDALRDSPVGRLVPISGWDPRFGEQYDHFAFVTNPLPEHLHLSPDTYACVTDAATAVARLDQVASQLPNPTLLARPAIRREAVSTSALEGTYAAFTDVLEADFKEQADLSASVREVVNFVRAAEMGHALVAEGRPISVHMLADLHAVLVQGTRSDTAEAGQVRTTQVFIGADRRRIRESRFVPVPPGHLLLDGVRGWEGWCGRHISGGHAIANIALSHYQFEAVHPFNDGNGRLGRLVAVLQMVRAGLLSTPVLSISPWLEERRDQYQEGLLRVSRTGDFDPWVMFLAEGICAQATEAVGRVNRLLVLRESFKQTLREVRAKGASLKIAEDLIGYPMIDINLAAMLADVSYQAANNAVTRLVEVGILRQRGSANYNRVFTCDAVLALLEPGS